MPSKKQRLELKRQRERLEILRQQVREINEQVAVVEDDYQLLLGDNKQITSNLVGVRTDIQHYQRELEKVEAEDQNEVEDVMPGDDKDDDVADEKTENEEFLSPAQLQLKKQKEAMMFQQLQKQVQQSVDRMVQNEIETVCNRVISSHIDPLEGNMNYIVIHANKQAIFKLKTRKDTFGQIKGNIAEYFGLPKDKIFLKNSRGEIMLNKNKVIDELFPLQSSKIKQEDPVIYVTFQKNMTTLDYILGDPNQKAVEAKEREDKMKELRENEERERKQQQTKEKEDEMEKMRVERIRAYNLSTSLFGLTSSIMFLFFAFMHISLALGQYDVGNMQQMGEAVSKSLIPDLDTDIMIAPKQFVSKDQLKKYFTEDMDNLFRPASSKVEEKEYFHQVNHIVPYMKLLLIQSKEKECGSKVANNIGKNKAMEAGEPYGPKYGYPYDGKCYYTYLQKEFKTDPIINETDSSKSLNYSMERAGQIAGQGLLNGYSDQGYTKIVRLNISNEHFYREMIQEEVIDQQWIDMSSTIAIIQSFYVYNPNLQMIMEKRIITEFLEPGGFINLEHQQMIANIKLYRNTSQNVQSIIILANGFGLIALSIIDIKKEMKQQMEAEAAGDEEEEEGAPGGEEGAGGEGKEDGEAAPAAPKEDKESLKYILINCSPFQKINFAMIIMVYCGQLLKYAYDFYAEKQLERIIDPEGYIDFTSLSTFNNICMFLDSIIINIGSISLLKYTQQAMPGLEAIILTVTEFFKGTFKKTMTMIILTYMLFGFMSHFILSYYQYGFFYIGYALLRSCIVFLNGFIINEQRILLSFESVENLMRYNGFGLTFSTMVIVNILIRQVMINIVAIFMHNDYHSAKIIARDLQKQRRLELEEKIKSQVRKDYLSEMMRQYVD